MGERRALIIGSQCKQFPPLSFLPKVAHELYAVLMASDLGECVSALPGQDGLLLDPTVDQARTAIKEAFQRASDDEATLFLAFIGHGKHVGDDFYLLPLDAQVPPFSDTAIHIVQLITEIHKVYSRLDGLVLLLDTCSSGVAAAGAAAQWVKGLSGTFRFEILTAAADRPAADGCCSRNLVKIISRGLETVVSEYLRCEQLRQVLLTCCPNQVPQLPAYNADDGLYLAKNRIRVARRTPWFGTSAAAEVERLTACFQPTPQLDTLVALSRMTRSVVVVGAAGTGKSALAAGLARPEATEGAVPERFVQALVFLSERTTAHELALQLADQLTSSLPAFASARDAFRHQTTPEELAALNALQREVIGPLYWVPPEACHARLVLDGLDRLAGGTAATVSAGLDILATDVALAGIQVIVTSRPDTPLPVHHQRLELGVTADQYLAAYLQRRQVPALPRQALVQRAQGNWLVVRLLADLVVADPAADLGRLPPDLAGLYAKRLRDAGASDLAQWRTELRPVVSALAAAGSGPVLPLPLLCAASAKLGIVHWTGVSGNPQEALQLFRALLPDQEQVLGPVHPHVLATRGNIAYWTGKTGDNREALRLYEALLPDQERVLGRHHPDTRSTRLAIHWYQAGML
ncbi:MAG TPA: tetratricopeptide repeat protein [Candidatus Tectomicrobia bacterium]